MDDYYITKVCNGEEEAYRFIVKKYQDMAFRTAISIVKNENTAQEIVQDAFVKAFKALKTFNRKSTFKTWFCRIVINEALKQLKRTKLEIIVYGDEGYEPLDESSILAAITVEQSILIDEALSRISANESLALRLFYLEEESIKSISLITGWSESNIKVILYRARKNLFVILKELMK